MSVLDKIPLWECEVNHPDLAISTSLKEIEEIIEQLSAGKAAGVDFTPLYVYKYGELVIAKQLLNVFTQGWIEARTCLHPSCIYCTFNM